MTEIFSPAHPGSVVLDEVLPSHGLNIASAARALGVARPGLHEFLNGKRGLSPELALKIEAAFGVSAQLLLQMQANHDLAQARRNADAITKGIERLPLAGVGRR